MCVDEDVRGCVFEPQGLGYGRKGVRGTGRTGVMTSLYPDVDFRWPFSFSSPACVLVCSGVLRLG